MKEKLIMPENKESVQDVEETSGKDSASTASSDYQENIEEKKENKKDNQKENKEQKNTRIIKKIIRGTKKEKNASIKFEEGISFRGKLIGVEDVKDARGDKICQDSLQKLKAAVKSAGEHKQKIIMSVSFQGIKITNEKSNEVVYHHPVHMISFTSLDINDSRAFGYICGTADEGHKFVAIKTEKAACQVVLTLQDLFQAVLEKKKQAMESAKKLQSKVADEVDCQANVEEKPPENQEINKEENEQTNKKYDCKAKQQDETKQDSTPVEVADSETAEKDAPFQAFVPTPPPPLIQSNIDDLLCLQLEVDQLQEGIAQMDNSMAAIAVTQQEPLYDPFNTSAFVLYPQPKDVFESTASSTSSSTDEQSAKPQLETSSQISPEIQETSSFYVTYNGNDKYSAFTKIDTISSIFENSQVSSTITTNVDDISICTFDAFSPIENSDKVPPPKPIRSPPKEDNLFADLDPLGKDRPFLDKKDFFYDLKNPPKKLLKDLVERPQENEGSTFYTSAQSAPESTEVSRTCQLSDVCPPFPCDFKNISPPQVPPRSTDVLSSSLPSTSILQRVTCDSIKKDALPTQTVNPFNPFGKIVPILSPPPLPPRLSSRASESSIKVSPIVVKSERANNVISTSPNTPMNMVSNQRRGSLPLNQLQPDLVYQEIFHNDNDNKNLTANSSHPIPIPSRKLVTNFQQNSFNSCNGQSLDNEHNKTPNSLEAESPPITDYFGHNLNDAITNSTKFFGSASRDKKSPMLKQCNRTSSCITLEPQLIMNGTSPRTRSAGTISLTREESQSIWAHAVNSNSNDKNCLVNGDNTTLNSDKTTCSPTIPLCEKFPNEHVSQTIPVREHGQKLNGVSSCEKSTKFCSNSASVFSSGSIFSRKLDPFADDFFAAPKKFNDYQRVPNEL